MSLFEFEDYGTDIRDEITLSGYMYRLIQQSLGKTIAKEYLRDIENCFQNAVTENKLDVNELHESAAELAAKTKPTKRPLKTFVLPNIFHLIAVLPVDIEEDITRCMRDVIIARLTPAQLSQLNHAAEYDLLLGGYLSRLNPESKAPISSFSRLSEASENLAQKYNSND